MTDRVLTPLAFPLKHDAEKGCVDDADGHCRLFYSDNEYEHSVEEAADVEAIISAANEVVRLRAERDLLRARCADLEALVACYRLRKAPSEALFSRLDKSRAAVDAFDKEGT